MKFKYCFVTIFILIVLIVIHPTKESMICKQNFHCEVKHEFCNIIKLIEKFDISETTKMDAFTLKLSRSHYSTYITLDNKNHFIMGAFSSPFSIAESTYLNKESIKFEKYKQRKLSEYSIDSIASPFYTYLWLFIYLLFAIPILSALLKDIKNTK